jgi:hypothetical protein
MVEMVDEEFKSLILKLISDLKEDSNKQMTEVKNSIQDLDEKLDNLDKKFSKEIEILKKKTKKEILEMKAQ